MDLPPKLLKGTVNTIARLVSKIPVEEGLYANNIIGEIGQQLIRPYGDKKWVEKVLYSLIGVNTVNKEFLKLWLAMYGSRKVNELLENILVAAASTDGDILQYVVRSSRPVDTVILKAGSSRASPNLAQSKLKLGVVRKRRHVLVPSKMNSRTLKQTKLLGANVHALG